MELTRRTFLQLLAASSVTVPLQPNPEPFVLADLSVRDVTKYYQDSREFDLVFKFSDLDQIIRKRMIFTGLEWAIYENPVDNLYAYKLLKSAREAGREHNVIRYGDPLAHDYQLRYIIQYPTPDNQQLTRRLVGMEIEV